MARLRLERSRQSAFGFLTCKKPNEEGVLPRVKILPTVVLLTCGGLSGLMISGLCLLYVMKNELAKAQDAAYSKLEQSAPTYTGQELALARKALADGLRKLYESNHDGGFTCYESNKDSGFSCMKPA